MVSADWVYFFEETKNLTFIETFVRQSRGKEKGVENEMLQRERISKHLLSDIPIAW
jgi:hypothetical protein